MILDSRARETFARNSFDSHHTSHGTVFGVTKIVLVINVKNMIENINVVSLISRQRPIAMVTNNSPAILR
jgi:hypothetical protein